MDRLIEGCADREGDRFCALAGPTALDPDALRRQRPDALWLLEGPSGPSRCALWWAGTPTHEGRRVGAIGHYFAPDAAAGARLLRRACARLAEQGCGLAVGPMDGNTWRRYRLVTERGSEPPFFLEPDNPDDWPAHFTAAGFSALAHYHSALTADLGREDPQAAEAARRFGERGGVLRPLALDRFEEELGRIHTLSLAAFRGNLLFTPIGADEFAEQYGGLRDRLRPELVLLAEQEGRLAGYVFALPDLLQARRGQQIDMVIVKTLAVHPDHAGAGLGALLASHCHRAARRLGYRRAIHALMHDGNRSARISRRTAAVFRRYALFARPLGREGP
jgi:GNAT superfamily N-acetyltransferase